MVRPTTSPTASGPCTSVDHPHPRTSCRLGTDGCIGCLLRWMVHRGMRPCPSVPCTLGCTASPNQLFSWWLRGGREKWETLYTASQEIDFDDELRKAATVSLNDIGVNDRQSLFFSSVCRWESARAHGRVPKLEGRIPRSHGVLGLHVQPCSLPSYFWHSKCQRRGLGRGCCHRCYIYDHYGG